MLLSVPADLAKNRLGLQTLISPDFFAPGNHVATRTIAASRRAVCCPRDGDGVGRGGDHQALFVGEQDEREAGEEEEERGCWVLYGWRRRLRRLPPLIPSLRRAGSSPWALTRTRTADGRVVLLREPAPTRGRVLATKLEGRLVLDLIEPDGGSPVLPPPRRRPPHPSVARGADAPAAAGEEEASAVDLGSARGCDVTTAVRAPTTMASSPVGSASASPLQAVGCFEAVIRTSPLRKMTLSLPRMVH